MKEKEDTTFLGITLGSSDDLSYLLQHGPINKISYKRAIESINFIYIYI